MENLDKVFIEQDVVDVSNKILSKTIEEIKNELSNSFYDEMGSYLYEQYDNVKDKIKKELIQELADEFVKDPTNYKYSAIRKKLFEENKELLTAAVSKELMEKGISDVVWGYLSEGNMFNWRWAEYVARFIKENIFDLVGNSYVGDKLLLQIRSQQQTINYLNQRVSDLIEDKYSVEE